jgi:glyoxylase-like metal-dependent hydrolase (beta-lactamase superfamily II)
MGVADGWVEVGDRIFVHRYAFFDQNIGVVLGRDEALVIDTRSTHAQAREILNDLRSLTSDPVTVVVDTHGHSDHAFGNAVFRPVTIWGHERCVAFMERTGEKQKAALKEGFPELADDFEEVVVDPPDRTFDDEARVEVGGREVTLRYLGRGHTDHDIVISVTGTDVLFAGDLVENGAMPYYGDAYPIDWTATAAQLATLVEPDRGVVVPGHGDHAGRAFADAQAASIAAVATLGSRVFAGEIDLDDALAAHPFPELPAEDARRPLLRAIEMVRGETERP